MDDTRLARWLGFAFDATIILSLTTLAVCRVVPALTFVALVGPLVGSRLSLRYLREGGGPGDHGGAGSATLSLALALAWGARRVFRIG